MEEDEANSDAAVALPARRHLRDARRGQTHHEDDDDDDHHQRDVVLVRQAARRHSPSAALRSPEGDDDARVHVGEDG